jgi:hypothetical protein
LRLVPHERHQEYAWQGADLLFGNYYALTGLTALALCAAYLPSSRRPGPANPADPGIASSIPSPPRETASTAGSTVRCR